MKRLFTIKTLNQLLSLHHFISIAYFTAFFAWL